MLQLWLITWKHIHNKKYITHYDPHILLETYFDRVYTVARRKFLLDTYKIATFSTTLMLTFQNNCHPYLWTDQKIKYTERLGIPTKQFSVHTEYLIMTFQSYNLTGEFLGFRSSVDEVFVLMGCDAVSLENWSSTGQDTLVVLKRQAPIIQWHGATSQNNGDLTTSTVSQWPFQTMRHLNIFEIIIDCLSFNRNIFSLLKCIM